MSRIQRCLPKYPINNGVIKEPIPIPTPATAKANAKAERPASGLFDALKVLRSSRSPVSKSDVRPPRWIAVAAIPRSASG